MLAMNAGAISEGKNSLPITRLLVASDRLAKTSGESNRCIGLYPRKAAKSAPVGGNPATWLATFEGIPAASNPEFSACGKLTARPIMTTLKKRDMLTGAPEFWIVALMPEATPRFSGGTEFITADMLGEVNKPMPRPISTRMNINGRYEKFAGNSASNGKPAMRTSKPAVARPLEP